MIAPTGSSLVNGSCHPPSSKVARTDFFTTQKSDLTPVSASKSPGTDKSCSSSHNHTQKSSSPSKSNETLLTTLNPVQVSTSQRTLLQNQTIELDTSNSSKWIILPTQCNQLWQNKTVAIRDSGSRYYTRILRAFKWAPTWYMKHSVHFPFSKSIE